MLESKWVAKPATRRDITALDAGEDVAFAYGLLRCGGEKEFAENPDNRLRLSMGLRRIDGTWLIAHEHHSFPDTA